jgi:hypothetical protein
MKNEERIKHKENRFMRKAIPWHTPIMQVSQTPYKHHSHPIVIPKYKHSTIRPPGWVHPPFP